MSWTWKLESNEGKELDPSAVPQFASQADAEAWVGDHWESLLADGVDSVALLEDDEVIYDGMSLHPPQ